MNSEPSDTVVVRYPPSPTGYLHIGNVRSLVFNYLFAKKHNGKIIYRAEDTDRERSKKEYEEYAVEAFRWLGLDFDERYRQSDRGDLYKRYLEKLIAEEKAYVSEEEPTPEQIERAEKEGKELRTSVIRLKNPGKVVTFSDIVLGDISTDTTDLGDFIIAKDLEAPLYHLTVVIDDHEMGVTHVIRGNDHVPNTARQILIQEAIGATRPQYAHLPLVVGTDGKKLSKRHGDTATLDYREQGYLPDALLNFLAFIGWNPGGEQEIFSREELIASFSLERVQKGSAVFNTEKLDWMNREHIRLLPSEQLKMVIDPFIQGLKALPDYNETMLDKILPIMIERIHNFGELEKGIREGEFSYFFEQPTYDSADLVWKKSDKETTRQHLEKLVDMITEHNGELDHDSAHTLIFPYADEKGRGDVLWPLRFALSGRAKSPDPFTLVAIFGKEEVIARLNHALSKL